MVTKDILIGQMIEEIGPLPDRWLGEKSSSTQSSAEDEKYTLEEWMFELYFDNHKEANMTREQLASWATIIRMLMRFEPAERVSAADVLRENCLLA